MHAVSREISRLVPSHFTPPPPLYVFPVFHSFLSSWIFIIVTSAKFVFRYFLPVLCFTMSTTLTGLNAILMYIGMLFFHVNAAPMPGLNIPMNAEEAQGWRPPSSLVRPNIATNVNFGFSTSVDKNTGLVNLAGGIADGFGMDAGFLAKTHGNSVTFTGGEGSSKAGIRNSAVGNGGVGSWGNVDAFVPMVPNGLALSKALSQTNAIGPMSMAGGHASGMVG